MAEVPEEIVVTIEADDRATPTLVSFSRSLVLLGANIAYVTRAMGLQNTVFDQALRVLLTVGHIVRAVAAAKTVLAAVTKFLAAAEAQQAAVTGASAGADVVKIGTTNALTASSYGLAGALTAVRAAMIGLGPVGWAMIAGGAVAGLAVGAYAGGAFGGGEVRGGTLGGGPALGGVNVNINMPGASFRTRGDAAETVQTIGREFHKQFRSYRI